MPDFHPPSRIEIAYRRQLEKLFRAFIPKRVVKAGFEEWVRRFAEVSKRQDLIDLATILAGRMAHQVDVHNARSWREAAARTQRSRYLYNLLQKEMSGSIGMRVDQIARENALLIRSLPQEVAQQLTKEIARAQQQGTRAEAISKMLSVRLPELAASRVHLISRTEVSKASTALTRARSEELNLPAYIWDTSEDQRVRPSHRNMDGVVVFWSDPPSPEALIGEKSSLGHYAPGDCPHCRCGPRPVLTLDDIYVRGTSMARVYYGGRIVRMTRPQFAAVSGIQSRAVA